MRRSLAMLASLLIGCTSSARPPEALQEVQPETVSDSDPGVDIAAARALDRPQTFTWAAWDEATFERARREGKPILVHGAATWCHWCHVMEETTYRDPQVGALIAARFVAIRVDIDARPDIEERYADWGWPATIVLSSTAEELAKLRGYVPADRMREHLRQLLEAPPEIETADQTTHVEPSALPRVARGAAAQLDRLYDEQRGSWGRRQKVPLGAAVTFELIRGGAEARRRAIRSLDGHAQLIDPVWGGIYQYSTHGDWFHPHFEKLLTYQAENISAFARGYAATGHERFRRHAESLVSYVNRFLSNGDGAFLVTQDADLGGFEHDAAFLDGHDYYALDEAGRLRRGVPRVDDSVYGEENGLAIAAYADLMSVTADLGLGERAQKAADLLLSTHVSSEGAVAHDAAHAKVKYLADAAALGHGLARLHEETGRGRYRDTAERIATYLEANLRDETSGAFWAHTQDPNASGVFARRRRPFAANVRAARLFAALHRITQSRRYLDRSREVLAGVAGGVQEQGRMIGEYLLALDEAGIALGRPSARRGGRLSREPGAAIAREPWRLRLGDSWAARW